MRNVVKHFIVSIRMSSFNVLLTYKPHFFIYTYSKKEGFYPLIQDYQAILGNKIPSKELTAHVIEF